MAAHLSLTQVPTDPPPPRLERTRGAGGVGGSGPKRGLRVAGAAWTPAGSGWVLPAGLCVAAAALTAAGAVRWRLRRGGGRGWWPVGGAPSRDPGPEARCRPAAGASAPALGGGTRPAGEGSAAEVWAAAAVIAVGLLSSIKTQV